MSSPEYLQPEVGQSTSTKILPVTTFLIPDKASVFYDHGHADLFPPSFFICFILVQVVGVHCTEFKLPHFIYSISRVIGSKEQLSQWLVPIEFLTVEEINKLKERG